MNGNKGIPFPSFVFCESERIEGFFSFFPIYFRDFIYAPKYPPLIFLLLLGLSLLTSVIIETAKRFLLNGATRLYKRRRTDSA